MYCCKQDQCPRANVDGKTCYCDARPFGLCNPDYCDAYCETYNNNPFGPKPLNWQETIKASCCSSVNYDNDNGEGSNKNQPRSSDRCTNASEGGLDFSKVLQYNDVYRGFNTNMNPGENEDDPCCKQNQSSGNKNRYCCGNIGASV